MNANPTPLGRLPAIGFAALILATAAAFFITQHLKIATPLIAGFPAPVPAAIDPYGSHCGGISHRSTRFSFYLLDSSDNVNVRIVDAAGRTVRHLAQNHHMRAGVRNPDGDFSWDGREDNGRIAPDGSYLIKVDLLHRGRTVTISSPTGPEPIRVAARPPRPRVTVVKPALIRVPNTAATLTYVGNEARGGTVRVFRTDLGSPPRLVKSFLTPWRGQQAAWNGRINNRPAPQGTYLIGLDVTDAACNTGHFPVRFPPPPGSTAGAGVTVRYLAATPPLDGIPAGRAAVIPVQSSAPVRWSVTRQGAVLAHGSGREPSLRLPPLPEGVFELRLRSTVARDDVPLIVGAGPPAGPVSVVAVLPTLSWQGMNPVDDNGDGLPNVLGAGDTVSLTRPLLDGPPAGSAAEEAVVAALQDRGHSVDPVGDLSLAAVLRRTRSLLLSGSETWLPAGLRDRLLAWVRGGGRLVSLGAMSMFRSVRVRGDSAAPVGGIASRDPFGLPAGDCAPREPLFLGRLATAGLGGRPSCVSGFRLGRGVVVEIRSNRLGALAATGGGARALLDRLWTVLTRGR